MTRIVVVDDVEDAAEAVSMLCGAVGHETYVAFDGAQALAQVKRVVPHIVFLDLAMPVMDGFETAAAIRAEPGTDHPFIIALTGVVDAGIEERTKAAGFDFHLTKPVDTNILLALVDDLARRARPVRTA